MSRQSPIRTETRRPMRQSKALAMSAASRKSTRSLLRTLGLWLALVAMVPLTSCAILSPPPPRAGGDRLSDAAKETAKKPEKQATLQGGEQKGCDGTEIDVAIVVSDPDDARRADSPPPVDDDAPRPHRNLFPGLHGGLIAGGGTLKDGEFAPFTLYGLRVGIEPARRTRLDLALMGGPSRFTPGSDVALVLRDPFELAADLSVRYALMSEHATASVSPLVGLRAGSLFWRYRNGITIDTDGELRTVDGDQIDHWSPYVGVAATVLRTRHFEVSGAAITGWRFYDTHTNHGLQNDLFRDARFTEFRLETTIPF